MKHCSDLASPIPCEKNPRVLFAGEATHDHYYSTLHAAYITGLREAERIVPLVLDSNKQLLKHKLWKSRRKRLYSVIDIYTII